MTTSILFFLILMPTLSFFGTKKALAMVDIPLRSRVVLIVSFVVWPLIGAVYELMDLAVVRFL